MALNTLKEKENIAVKIVGIIEPRLKLVNIAPAISVMIA
ncbi:MAG: hypothetical protein MRERV_13c032 [Mycoplasmataceae bacterium RV_VA103A]|nr:MAG: hypothetical protein MRERV_13c032 [Mycoplasmataceae bacterium RV_VA103A]